MALLSSTSGSSSVSSRSASSTVTTPSTASRGKDDVTFNTNKLQELGSRGQWLLRHLAIMTHTCGVKDAPNLRRKLLGKSEVTCNDGSPAGYYIRRSHGSDKWIVFLEGGWYCFDHISCSERFRLMPEYMSSKHWPKFRVGSGILSWDPEENPYYFHSNVVYIPYCSSDSWSGTRNKTSVMDFSFMGSLILEKVFNELLKKRMKKAKSVIVAGTSAGGTGVLINLDRIADLIRARDPKIEVKGLVDSGWFLDNESFKSKPCRDAFTCSPMAGIQKGAQVWEPRLPQNCTSLYPKEVWRCFFGHRVYASIKTPIYIIQNLYDAAQIKVNNIFEERVQSHLSSEQWRYLLTLGEEVKETLQNASAVFAPACVSHEILTKPEWHTVHIDGTSLPQSIHCWETNQSVTSSCSQSSIKNSNSKNETPLSDSPRHNKNHRRRRKKGKRKGRNKKRKNNSMDGENNRNSRSVTKRCQHKLLDACPWPHCNCSCPKCHWDTMTQVNQFFLQTLATVMGIDPAKMANVRLCGY
ncbi:hypothetical protein BsWGS_13028 [Bradybaena similaris]